MTDIIEIGINCLPIKQDSYVRSYPHLLTFFSEKEAITESDFVCGSHMVYGWMRKTLNMNKHPEINFSCGADILNLAKSHEILKDEHFETLAALVNNSLVGASKLLHFVNPEVYPIWDSHVFRFMRANDSGYKNNVSSISNYTKYLAKLNELQKDPRFSTLHTNVNTKLGYKVSAIRALEIVIFYSSLADAK